MLRHVANQWLAQPIQEELFSGKTVRVTRDEEGQTGGPRWVVTLRTGRGFTGDREDDDARLFRNVGKYSPKATVSRL
jgi:hypothetical protein